MTPVPQRARKPHQKAARRQAMLDAARDLMASRSFDEIAVRDIPDRLGLAKGTVYRYFASKEEVFLSVLEQDVDDFTGALVEALEPLAGSDGVTDVVDAITATTVARPRFCELLSLLPTVLETNVSEHAAREFKTTVAASVARIGPVLGAALPQLDPDVIPDLIVTFQALVIGLWRTAHPSAAVAAVVADPSLAFLHIDFGDHLGRVMVAIIRGCAGD